MTLKEWQKIVASGRRAPYLHIKGPQASGKTTLWNQFVQKQDLDCIFYRGGKFNGELLRADIVIIEGCNFSKSLEEIRNLYYEPIIPIHRKGKHLMYILNNLNFIQDGGDVSFVKGVVYELK